MVIKDLEYLYAGKGPDTKMQKQIKNFEKVQEKLYEKQVAELEKISDQRNTDRLKNRSVSDMSWDDLEIMNRLIQKGDILGIENPEYASGDNVKTLINEALADIEHKISQNPRYNRIPGAKEKVEELRELVDAFVDGKMPKNLKKRIVCNHPDCIKMVDGGILLKASRDSSWNDASFYTVEDLQTAQRDIESYLQMMK